MYTPNDLIRIGCWFSAKKQKKVNLEHLGEILHEKGAELKEIDLDEDLDKQGPFHAIIHKMTDRMIDAMDGNTRARKNMEDVERYINANPNMVVVDPLESIAKLLDRYETYSLIKNTKLCSKGVIHIPAFTLIKSHDKMEILKQMEKANVKFPFVCKKSIAHGSASHKMSIIFNEKGLSDVDPPCVAQTFISHGALLYKIYVIADTFHVVKRPSLRNLSSLKFKDHSTIFFNSHNISSGDSSRSNLTTLDDEDRIKPVSLDLDLVRQLTSELHTEINMTMYGVDIIVCPQTGRHYVIDVNVFPGYDGVPNFLETLVDKVFQRIPGLQNGSLNENKFLNNNNHEYKEKYNNGEQINTINGYKINNPVIQGNGNGFKSSQ